jgi:hypothetical protein
MYTYLTTENTNRLNTRVLKGSLTKNLKESLDIAIYHSSTYLLQDSDSGSDSGSGSGSGSGLILTYGIDITGGQGAQRGDKYQL